MRARKRLHLKFGSNGSKEVDQRCPQVRLQPIFTRQSRECNGPCISAAYHYQRSVEAASGAPSMG